VSTLVTRDQYDGKPQTWLKESAGSATAQISASPVSSGGDPAFVVDLQTNCDNADKVFVGAEYSGGLFEGTIDALSRMY
jgi:hypothetical protein